MSGSVSNAVRPSPNAGTPDLEERPRKRQRSTSPTSSNGHAAAVQQPIVLEPSYFGVKPHDDFTREVGNWLWGWCQGRANVEIEAKIGILLDTSVSQPQRLYFPVANESIITDPDLCRFESNMTNRQHAAFNELLNTRVEEQASPSFRGARVKHQHTKEVDFFHPSSGKGGKVRVTMNVANDGTMQPKANGIVEKQRIANMNVYSPKQMFDFRISVSTETPHAEAPQSRPTTQRFKDRISYRHQILQVDLTKVEAKESSQQAYIPPSYELEIEFMDIKTLLREGAKQAQEDPPPNVYFEMIQVFLNTIRMLIKNAEDP